MNKTNIDVPVAGQIASWLFITVTVGMTVGIASAAVAAMFPAAGTISCCYVTVTGSISPAF